MQLKVCPSKVGDNLMVWFLLKVPNRLFEQTQVRRNAQKAAPSSFGGLGTDLRVAPNSRQVPDLEGLRCKIQ